MWEGGWVVGTHGGKTTTENPSTGTHACLPTHSPIYLVFRQLQPSNVNNITLLAAKGHETLHYSMLR